jgi:hypothetical protein
MVLHIDLDKKARAKQKEKGKIKLVFLLGTCNAYAEFSLLQDFGINETL